jgi:hypothetical protein
MPSINMVIPIVMRNESASIFRAGCLRMNSPIGLAKKRMAINDITTAAIMIHILSVRPIAVITESIENTMSRSTI